MNLNDFRFELVHGYLRFQGYDLEIISVKNNITSVTAVMKNECLAEGYEDLVICNSDLMAYMWGVISNQVGNKS